MDSISPQTQNPRFQMVTNDRTAGSIPSYNKQISTDFTNSFKAENAETYDVNIDKDTSDGFGFWDFIDMINPLQHLPVVNIAYRAITGDEIKPISQIIGGAVFGGPVGAASGLVNAVIKEETGEDAVGNALSLIRPNRDENSQIQEMIAYNDLPVTLLEFAQTPISSIKET